MIHNLLILICAFIILARETKYKILILRVDEIMLALFLAALESNEDKQVFIKIYEQHLPLISRQLNDLSRVFERYIKGFGRHLIVRWRRYLSDEITA